nr:TetR/AcrR family transcriptional regulator [Pseudomaricurvus alcaniphilus]
MPEAELTITRKVKAKEKVPAKEVAKINGPIKRRRNKRSENTIQTIFDAAEQVILVSGAERVSILDVCKVADISRGTFYRYFSSQDELLDAFSKFKRDRFHTSLTVALAPFNDPDERFNALVNYLNKYLEQGRARKLLTVAPQYAMGWFNRIFHDAIERFQVDLRIVFDAWDERLGVELDRELICEFLIRYILSEQLVKSTPQRRRALPKKIRRMVQAMVIAHRL